MTPTHAHRLGFTSTRRAFLVARGFAFGAAILALAACSGAGESTDDGETTAEELTAGGWPGHVAGKFYLGMSCGTECATKESQLGRPYGVHRQFYAWGSWSGMAKDIQADASHGRMAWVSVKPPSSGSAADGWRAVASGQVDSGIHALATMLKANSAKPVLLTFHHEPSNDGTEADGAIWAKAYSHFHDVLKQDGALANVADPPIIGEYLFNPYNKAQDPANWLTSAVMQRMPFLGVDLYENASGDGFSVRLTRIIDWMAARGFTKMVGIGEMGCTDAAYPKKTAVQCINENLAWAKANTAKIGVVSYFNSQANSKDTVYWPLDESQAKLGAFRTWLDDTVTIN